MKWFSRRASRDRALVAMRSARRRRHPTRSHGSCHQVIERAKLLFLRHKIGALRARPRGRAIVHPGHLHQSGAPATVQRTKLFRAATPQRRPLPHAEGRNGGWAIPAMATRGRRYRVGPSRRAATRRPDHCRSRCRTPIVARGHRPAANRWYRCGGGSRRQRKGATFGRGGRRRTPGRRGRNRPSTLAKDRAHDAKGMTKSRKPGPGPRRLW